ncbi:L,D-transpeptidase family protein [Alteraurantiacibacter aquimixticola]|uniref:L,D-transpeptidase n=1 Tax=Alteraurantiacibacter aquimixticola TaxID=2489173 RepID=A0A4T3F1V9_9SPHN|nr:L,D-transpeptidase family protein [Alteraurantiacibacter aquimixticola]TIX51205.1 L,D-transpeptidase [Alteraurantiacibacter aquimixticola]
MNSPAKWIGGATAVSVMLIASMAFGGNALVAKANNDEMASWIEGNDVLAENTAVTAAAPVDLSLDGQAEALPEFTSQPVVQEVPAYDPENPFVIKRVLPIEGPIRYGEWHWDDEGVPDGPLVMTVDLQARVISVFRNGYEIGAAATLLGTPDHPTPTGTFPILTKERHNVSEKYNNAPMPWTLRLTWDGVAIHGGSTVELGYASHGCIGVPDEFVSRLYDIAKVGDVVIITDGVMTGVGGQLGG